MMHIIDEDRFDRLSAEAAARPRRRANWNLHASLADPVQRFLNAMEPGTYTRPHRHLGGDRWEVFLVLRGAVAVVTFAADGALASRTELRPGGTAVGIEIPPRTWHAVTCLEPGTVVFEVKPGPYDAATDKDFAPWAPVEGDAAATAFERWIHAGALGSAPPGAV